MKYLLILLFSTLIIGCKNQEKDEFEAIEDVVNEFLALKHLPKILNPINFSDEPIVAKPNIDSIKFKIYISDALLPISQIKEDNEFLFLDTLKSKMNNKIFHDLLFSKGFEMLKYREFDKSKMRLNKPYIEIFSIIKDIDIAHEEYVRFSFSRVCFDKDKKYGILFMNYFQGYNNGGMGQDYVLLIKFDNDKWNIVFDDVWKDKFGEN
jgi:hypothetical protein